MTKIVKGLDETTRTSTAYAPELNWESLPREPEAVKPKLDYDSDDDNWYFVCGACYKMIDYKDGFCRHCGRKVKWDG